MWMFFSAYMSGSSSPATSSAPTIYQLSSLPPPSTLTRRWNILECPVHHQGPPDRR